MGGVGARGGCETEVGGVDAGGGCVRRLGRAATGAQQTSASIPHAPGYSRSAQHRGLPREHAACTHLGLVMRGPPQDCTMTPCEATLYEDALCAQGVLTFPQMLNVKFSLPGG